MLSNQQIIEKFYSSFQQLDYTVMNQCYSDDIVFFDPAFGLLKDNEVRCMWEMLCKNARDFSLTFGNIKQLDDEYYTCDWVATYTFSKTGRHVVNKARANMRLDNGKILEHSDAFSLHNWSKQAFGITGILFGWNTYFQNRVKNTARKNLMAFMTSKQ